MGIVTGLRGYMQAKENGHLAQKAQIALTRINRELMELTDVISRDDGADPWVVFDNRLLGRQAIAKVGEGTPAARAGLERREPEFVPASIEIPK